MNHAEFTASLAASLKVMGAENFGSPLSDEQNAAMQNMAEHLSEQVWGYVDANNTIVVKGSKTVAEINAMTGMSDGEIWGVKDGGVITNDPVTGEDDVSVVAGDLVIYGGGRWSMLMHMDLSVYDDALSYSSFEPDGNDRIVLKSVRMV